jgi:hypothetical protein
MRSRQLPDPMSITIPQLDADPAYRQIAARIADLEETVRATEQRRSQARAQLRALRPEVLSRDIFKPARGVVETGLALVAGGRFSTADPALVIAAAEKEILALREALWIERARLEDRRGELSVELAERFQPLNRAALAAGLAAMGDLYAAFEVARTINVRLQAAQYKTPSWMLPVEGPEGIYMLGSPDDMATPAGRFRRWLEDLK